AGRREHCGRLRAAPGEDGDRREGHAGVLGEPHPRPVRERGGSPARRGRLDRGDRRGGGGVRVPGRARHAARRGGARRGGEGEPGDGRGVRGGAAGDRLGGGGGDGRPAGGEV